MLRNPGTGWEQMHILSNNISSSGGILQVTDISDVVLTSEPVTGTLDPDLLGTVNVSLTIALDRLVTGNNLTQRIISGANESVSSAFQLAGAGSGLNVDAVAYTLEVKNTAALNANLSTSGQFVPVQINMSVSHRWVSLHGGTSAIKIIRYSEEGKKQVLNTSFRFNDPVSGMDYFTRDSAEGLSIFGITSTSARISSGGTDSSGASDSDPYADAGKPGTKAAVDAPIIPEDSSPFSPASAGTGAPAPGELSHPAAP